MVFVDRAGCVASLILSRKFCGLKVDRLPGKVISSHPRRSKGNC